MCRKTVITNHLLSSYQTDVDSGTNLSMMEGSCTEESVEEKENANIEVQEHEKKVRIIFYTH